MCWKNCTASAGDRPVSSEGYACLDGTSWTGSGMRPSLKFRLLQEKVQALKESPFRHFQVSSHAQAFWFSSCLVAVYSSLSWWGLLSSESVELELDLEALGVLNGRLVLHYWSHDDS